MMTTGQETQQSTAATIRISTKNHKLKQNLLQVAIKKQLKNYLPCRWFYKFDLYFAHYRKEYFINDPVRFSTQAIVRT